MDRFAGTVRWLKTGLVLILVVLGCSKPAAEIVGTWDNTKGAETAEFRADGTGTFLYANKQNPPLAFTWKQSAEKNYLVEVNYQGSKKVLMASVNDKSMKLESSVGSESYKKR